jgi:hypothetical protein
MSNTQRDFQVVDAFRGGPGTPPGLDADGETNLAYCREFDSAYPPRHLRHCTCLWAFVAAVAAIVDIVTMRQIIGLKFTDPLGNPTAGEAVMWFAAMLTLSIFFVMAILWEKGGAAMKLLPGGIYAMLLTFLAVTLWPTEAPTLRSIWDSTVAGASGGFDNAAAAEPVPNWFLALGIGLLACVATMPGMLFILAKARLAWYAALWRVRSEAQKLLADSRANDGVSDAAATATEVGTHFSDASMRQQAIDRVVQRALLAYEQAVRGRVEDAKAQLANPLAKTPRERDELMARIRAGDGLVQQIATLHI